MAVIIFFLLFSSIFLNTEAIDKNCPPAKCFPNGPEILFPFSIKGLQPQNCSYPGFKLLCKENKTTIHFPSYGDLVVKSISYDSKRLMSLLDPENCVHQVFLNLDLSQTPFRYYFVLKNYTYLNCSAALPRPFVQVLCMSGSKYHVYVVASFGVVPDSCKPVKTVAIPFSYSPCLADDSFGRDLARRFRHMFQCSTRKGPEYPRLHFHGCNPCQCQDLLLQKRLVREVMQALCYPQTCKILPEGGKKSG